MMNQHKWISSVMNQSKRISNQASNMMNQHKQSHDNQDNPDRDESSGNDRNEFKNSCRRQMYISEEV
jgi:hypothetical protein